MSRTHRQVTSWLAATVAVTLAGTSAAAATRTTPASDAPIGLIDGVYQGAGGFVIDPADCPEDWNPAQGISDTEIRLFQSLPQSGSLAGFAAIGDGERSYFEYINENGGIDGRQIVLVSQDDAYAPDRTISNVDEALESGEYAGLFDILGMANNLAVWDVLNDECMPHLFNGIGGPEAGDVTNHPWSTGMGLVYPIESSLWAQWLSEQHPDATRVAELTFNNDYGSQYADGFRAAIDGTDIEIVASELHDATAPNVTNQITSIAAAEPDVVLLETAGTFCTQAMAEIEKREDFNPIVIMSANCVSSQFFSPLIEQGLTGDGTYLVQSFKDPIDPALADEEFVKLYHDTLTAQGLDSSQTTYWTGWMFGWFMVQALQDASTYEGGLDRGNLILAARNLQVDAPVLLDGLTSRTNGLEDAYHTEGGQMVRYTVEDPTELGVFVPDGPLINREGELGTYDQFLENAG